MDISTPDYVSRRMAMSLDNVDLDADDTPVVAADAASPKQVEFARSLYREISALGEDDEVLAALGEACADAKSSKSLMTLVIDNLIRHRDALKARVLADIPVGIHAHPDGGRRKVVRSKTGNLYALDLDNGNEYLGQAGLAGLSTDTLEADATALAAEAAQGRPAPAAPEGIHRTADGQIWKVQVAVHGSGNPYAKRLTDPATATFEYAPGAISRLSEATLMTLDEAREYGHLYGMCIRCGRTLTDEDSIAYGVGPVCAQKGW